MTRSPSSDRRLLESPWLAAGLGLVAIAIAAVLFFPSLLGGPGSGSSPTPGSGSGQPSVAPTAPGPTFVRPTPSPQPTFISYVVKPGDTLSRVARELGTTAFSISWWNRTIHPSLDPESSKYDPDRLDLGWVLQILPDSIVDENIPPTETGQPNPRPLPTSSAGPTG